MIKTLVPLFIVFCTQLVNGQNTSLFRIIENDKVGYINGKGEVVIKPVFLNGNDFSEGLAPVRLNGLYGFIDESGLFVIKPQYDFASSFRNGIAFVNKDGVSIFINKKGEIELPPIYNTLKFVDDRRAIIITTTGKEGVIDIHTKKLLIDTAFGSIDDFQNGVAIVGNYIAPGKKQQKKKIALVDTTGKLIVPFGKYLQINRFVNGYALVEIEDRKNKDGNIDGVIDSKGNLLFQRPYKNHSYIADDFHEGLAVVTLYKHWIPEEKGVIHSNDKNYQGYINLKGEVVLDNPGYTNVENFSDGRAFAKKEHGDYILIDKNFKQVGSGSYINIFGYQFNNGYAIVETRDGYGIIDTMGNYVIKPQENEIDASGILGSYFFSIVDDNDRLIYEISDLKGNKITKAAITDFDRAGFINGLLRTSVNNKLTYINEKGKMVWQKQDEILTTLKPLNIDFMNRGYFYAYSSPKNPEASFRGGWAISDNTPKKITANQFAENALSIEIDTTKTDSFSTKHAGYKLFISNTTSDTIRFSAQDSRLDMKLQAQDKSGEWKDIEYLPSSWCGNSYHHVQLEPSAFWSFIIPNYEGEFPTKIRAKLKYIDKSNPKEEKIIYSNTINGSVNPGQFWNKRSYYPNGLMDPYID